MELSEKIRNLPLHPGVYLFKDDHGRILYVGKAKSLKTRVKSYLKPGSDGRIHIKFLMDRAVDLDWMVTASEKEALILENTLIKKHRPRYNIDLKDDKTYLSLRLDIAEPFPRLDLVRRVRKDGAHYLGPYTSARDLRATVEVLLKIFPLRSCPDSEFKSKKRPCLYHWTRRCPAPCVGMITREDYHKLVDEIDLFLKGRSKSLAELLTLQMRDAAAAEKFEAAAALRDRLKAVEATLLRQRTVTHKPVDRDVIAWVREGAELMVVVLVVRSGAIIDQRSYHLAEVFGDDEEFAGEFLRSYYREDRIVPPEIVLAARIAGGAGFVEYWLSEKRGGKVRVTIATRGEKMTLVKMAMENAASLLAQHRKSKEGFDAALEDLRSRLGMERTPRRMECFDVSNFQGGEPGVGMVRFTDGVPDKAGYRRFSIKTVEGANDFAMLHEAVSRRMARAGQEGWEAPDLLVIDGGRGQLASVQKALEEWGGVSPLAVGLAKARTLAGSAEPLKTPERVFLPGRVNPLILPQNSSALFLLQRIRDEAHRFALEFHRKKRGRRTLTTELLEVEGLGPKRAKILLKHFGSLKGVKAATLRELLEVPTLPAGIALLVHRKFSPEANGKS